MDKTILFVSTTKRNDLCCLSAFINPEEQHDPSAKSDFHWQILKCRQLIFECEELIAAPALGNQIQIQMIMRKKFYGTGKVQGFLEKLKMPGHQVQLLTNEIYESCLRYTIIARIAPQWNQMQNYLIQGRKFLHSVDPLNAIRLEVEVKDDSMYVVLTPTKVKLHGFTVDDLEIPPALSQEFKSQIKMSIHDITMGPKWVHVLPSMKRGRIMTISHGIPNSCPYKTYKDLKRHWKNSYGYRLPESDDGLFYCTLSFHPMIPTKYTYPSICLMAAPLQLMPRIDERRIVSAFLTDLAKKMPYACGNPFKINGELGYTIPQSIQQIKENIRPSATVLEPHTGLLPKPRYESKELEILSNRDMNCSRPQDAGILPSTQSSCGVSLTNPQPNFVGEDTVRTTHKYHLRLDRDSSSTSLNDEVAETPELAIEKNISNTISAILESKQEHVGKVNDSMSLEKNVNLRTAGDSIFDRNTIKRSPQKLMAVNMARHSQPLTESAFASNSSQLASTPGKNRTDFIESARGTIPRTSIHQQWSKTSLAFPNLPISDFPSVFPGPFFQGHISNQVSFQPDLPRTPQAIQKEYEHEKYTPNFSVSSTSYAARAPEMQIIPPKKYTPVFAPPALPCSQSVQKTRTTAAKTNPERAYLGSMPVLPGKVVAPQSMPKIPTFGTQLVLKSPHVRKVSDFVNMPISTNLNVPDFGAQCAKQPTKTLVKFPAFGNPKESKALMLSPKKNNLAASSSQKRGASTSPFLDAGVSSSGSKKPRARPQVQTDINVEELARTNKLENANAPTLLNWLQKKNLPVTTREKKADLISKVKNILGINK